MQQFTHLTFPFKRATAMKYMGIMALSEGTDNEDSPSGLANKTDRHFALTIALTFP